MVRVGLTGNIASGKSAVADVWQRLGATVVDADELARRVVEPGTEGLAEVVKRFGSRVLQEDGTLDRAALRQHVFDQPAERRALERILHPRIGRLRDEEEHRLAEGGEKVVVHVIPLLFETGLDRKMDVIVFVDAPELVRRQRLIATRGLSEDEASKMIAAQMPAKEKRARATITIDNVGSLAELEAEATRVWHALLEQAG